MTHRMIVNIEVTPIGGSLPGEIWKPVAIEDFGDYYHVSNMGRVMRVKPHAISTQKIVGKIRKACTNSCDRIAYALYRGSRKGRSSYLGHFMVMITFVGPRPRGAQINNINGNHLDNRLSNLEYVTVSRNQTHSYEIGLVKRKLSPDDIREIRNLWWTTYLSYIEIGSKFDIHIQHVSVIIRGLAWGWLDNYTPPSRRESIDRRMVIRNGH